MSCPNCDHTVAVVIQTALTAMFHCERCGTMLIKHLYAEVPMDVYTPKLVERCRRFEASFPPGNPPTVSYSDYWRMCGIHEAINTPDRRPQ